MGRPRPRRSPTRSRQHRQHRSPHQPAARRMRWDRASRPASAAPKARTGPGSPPAPTATAPPAPATSTPPPPETTLHRHRHQQRRANLDRANQLHRHCSADSADHLASRRRDVRDRPNRHDRLQLHRRRAPARDRHLQRQQRLRQPRRPRHLHRRKPHLHRHRHQQRRANRVRTNQLHRHCSAFQYQRTSDRRHEHRWADVKRQYRHVDGKPVLVLLSVAGLRWRGRQLRRHRGSNIEQLHARRRRRRSHRRGGCDRDQRRRIELGDVAGDLHRAGASQPDPPGEHGAPGDVGNGCGRTRTKTKRLHRPLVGRHRFVVSVAT